MRTGMAGLSLFAVVHASEGFKGITGVLLRSFLLRSIGKVSYGIYIFHLIVPNILTGLLLKIIFRLTGYNFTWWGTSFKIISILLLLLVANLSWILIEKPINNLKKHFVV